MPPDLLGQAVERPADDGLDHLGILPFRERRGPDEVGEERGPAAYGGPDRSA